MTQAQSAASSAMSQLNSTPVSPHDPGAASARAYAEANIQSTMDQEIGLAVGAGQAAWDQFEAAAARTAAQIGNAIPSWSSISKDIGWLNDKAGFGLVPLGIGFLAPLGGRLAPPPCRLADVALEQGSLSSARRTELYQRAGQIAATYNDPLNNYNPDHWTPEGWRKAYGTYR